ncbi:grainyhead-like protein 1 homolog [Gadus morhua]|uniref:grainyhead-like protein 1 homolog n=1 Tax=Gadus morhua TaxID=8049 RepID=UPI0011B3BC59|nr:grainyhead-like protein 1 homolog [Gadus morhua]
MTEESARKRGVVTLTANQSYEGVSCGYQDDDDVWRAFLESPLTAASKAMMSVNGDEEATGALGMLYECYKIPRDRKPGFQFKTESPSSEDPETSKTNSSSFPGAYQDSLLTMTPLTNVSLHNVVRASPPEPAKRVGSYSHPYPEPIVPPPPYSDARHALPEGVAPPPRRPQTAPQGFRAALGGPGSLGHRGSSPGSLTPDSTCQGFALAENLQMRLGSVSSDDLPLDSSTCLSFEYILEAPQSLRPKSCGGPTSYLNKGQFYPITLCYRDDGSGPPKNYHSVRSVVMLVFGEEKAYEDQLKHWRFWQSRQHTVKQHCLDIADYKESFNTISKMEEIAYNAVSFTWDVKNEARIFISVNCLSTDFSPQKGVRGLPLNLQVDTYAVGRHGDRLVHRAVSQVKVFCDKGAERKIRDEERKQSRRRMKGLALDTSGTLDKNSVKYYDLTVFTSLDDLDSVPVLFIPESSFSQRHGCLTSEGVESSGQRRPPFQGDPAPAKRPRHDESNRVLLYVRREEEEVFDALMLNTPTLSGLLQAVNEKYNVPLDRFGNVYKRCKKGMLLNVDDNIIEHCSNEDTFQIDMEEQGGQFVLTLTEI